MIEVVTVIKACFNLFQQGGLVVEYRKIQRWLAIASDNKQEHGSNQLMARGWNWMIFQVPSNQSHSVIPWCKAQMFNIYTKSANRHLALFQTRWSPPTPKDLHSPHPAYLKSALIGAKGMAGDPGY